MSTRQLATTSALERGTTRPRECGQAHTESADACPACGQSGALIALGARYDHPYRWRPWVMKPTQLALCARCDALAEMEEKRQPSGQRALVRARDPDWRAIAGR